MYLFLPIICYAAVLINFTYYAQYYAHVKDLCLGMQYFVIKLDCFITVYCMLTVLLEYIDLWYSYFI